MQGGCNEVVKDAVRRSTRCRAGLLGVWAALWTGCFLALALGLHGTAYADTQYQPSLAGVVQGPTPWADYNGPGYYDGYLIYGANKYDCLLYALDLNPDDFDLVARAKLSSPSTGGMFYEIVQRGYNDDCPEWVNVAFYEGWLRQSGIVPPSSTNPQWLWAFEMYPDEYEQAKDDAETVRDGGDVEGGGSGGESGGGSGGSDEPVTEGDYHFAFNLPKANKYEGTNKAYAYQITGYSDNGTPTVGDTTMQIGTSDGGRQVGATVVDTMKVYMLGTLYNDILESRHDRDILARVHPFSTDVLEIYLIPTGSYSFTDTILTINGGTTYQVISCRVPYTSKKILYDDDKVCVYAIGIRNNVTYTKSDDYVVNIGGSTPLWADIVELGDDGGGGEGGGGEGGGEDEPSPDPWPDPEPTTPTPQPPELPEPGDPTQPVEPTVPTPDPPDLPGFPYPDPTSPEPDLPDVESDVSFTADLQGIIDALNEHCIHLQERMIECTEYIKSWMRWSIEWEGNQILTRIDYLMIYLGNVLNYNFETLIGDNHNLVEYLADRIGNDLAALIDYLEECTKWLDKKLDYQFPTFDDNSIVYWLKRLYYKKGTGTDSRPVDPVTDPFGIGDWLRNLANLLIQALEGLAPGLVGDLLEKLDLLTGKFPFSLPWDIMAVLGAFVAQPEAPSVEWPCYAYQNGQVVQVATYDVDMSAYDDVMEGVRFVGFLGFAVYTMTLVPKWVDDLTGVVESA